MSLSAAVLAFIKSLAINTFAFFVMVIDHLVSKQTLGALKNALKID